MGYKTAEDKNMRQIPIVGLDFASGLHVAFTSGAASSVTPSDGGAFAFSTTKDAFISVGGTAQNGAGSIFLPSGALVFLLVQDGQAVSVRGASDSGSLFVVPLEG